jgi:hypothetical protein
MRRKKCREVHDFVFALFLFLFCDSRARLRSSSFPFSAVRHSSEETPQTDAFIDSLIVLVEQMPPLSLADIERSTTSSESVVCFTRIFLFPHFCLTF